ncbi:hypothetical protein JCM12856_03700 [Spirochaeta dissipatitropha]
MTYDEIEQKIQERVIDPVMQEALMLSTAQMLKEEGRQETVYETADRMLDRDYPLQEIAELTGLSLEEVERLSKEKHASDS